jgi:glycosyltransferase involved in cell wall biosynthesis
MRENNQSLRVLHSFPHRLGKARICTTAWYEINSVAGTGAEMFVLAGDSVRAFTNRVNVETTLARGRFRIPSRLLGTQRLCALHDWLVARKLPSLAGHVDIVHAWPLGALETIKVAKRLGIPVALERCNAHTRFAYEVVRAECDRLGVPLPADHEHAYNKAILRREEEEYQLADALLCPSDFVVKTFVDCGYPREKLINFFYGVDETVYFPGAYPASPQQSEEGLTMIFVGVCAVRKGLHYALEAWLKSSACKSGRFLIAGDFLPEYKEKLATFLAHPSVQVLGHRSDVPELMRNCGIFVLPSIEEGFGLVCTEAMASGCVPLVSDACTELCKHNENSLVHAVGDVRVLTEQINLLNEQRSELARLRAAGLRAIPTISWTAAGRSLAQAYSKVIDLSRSS